MQTNILFEISNKITITIHQKTCETDQDLNKWQNKNRFEIMNHDEKSPNQPVDYRSRNLLKSLNCPIKSGSEQLLYNGKKIKTTL